MKYTAYREDTFSALNAVRNGNITSWRAIEHSKVSISRGGERFSRYPGRCGVMPVNRIQGRSGKYSSDLNSWEKFCQTTWTPHDSGNGY